MNARLSSIAGVFLSKVLISFDTTPLNMDELHNIRYRVAVPNMNYRFVERVVVVNKLKDIFNIIPKLGVLYKVVFGKEYVYIGPRLIVSKNKKILFDFLDSRTLVVSSHFLSDNSIITKYFRKVFAISLCSWNIRLTNSPRIINDYKSMNSISSFVINQVNRLNAD